MLRSRFIKLTKQLWNDNLGWRISVFTLMITSLPLSVTQAYQFAVATSSDKVAVFTVNGASVTKEFKTVTSTNDIAILTDGTVKVSSYHVDQTVSGGYINYSNYPVVLSFYDGSDSLLSQIVTSYERPYYGWDIAGLADGGSVLLRTNSSNGYIKDLLSYDASGCLRASNLNFPSSVKSITGLKDGSVAALNSPPAETGWIWIFDAATLNQIGTFDYSTMPTIVEHSIAGLSNGGLALYGNIGGELYVYVWDSPTDSVPTAIKLSDYGVAGKGFDIGGDVFTAIKPELQSEPAITPGTSNDIAWNSVTGAALYYAECATNSSFTTNLTNSGWISGNTCAFDNLTTNQTYWYRVKSKKTTITDSWSQANQADFDTDTLNDVSTTTTPGDVVLAGGDSESLNIFIYGSSISPGFQNDLIAMGHTVTNSSSLPENLTPYDVVILAAVSFDDPVSASTIDAYTASGKGLVIFEGTIYSSKLAMTADSCPVSSRTGWALRTGTNIFNFSNPLAGGLDNTSTLTGYSTNPTLKSGADAAIRWTADGVPMAVTYANGEGKIVYINDLWAHYSSKDWDGDHAYGVALMQNILNYVTSAGEYAPSGNIVSTPISLSPPATWTTIMFTKTTPVNTGLTIDILRASDNTVLVSNVASGTDISGITETSIRLRANLLTYHSGSTPSLQDWSVSYTDDSSSFESDWSNVVFSQQSSIPGDANNDGSVDVGDLGILAANYGGTGKTWAQGDFNDDGAVDVGDLGILAANYGQSSSESSNFEADCAEAFSETANEDSSETGSLFGCDSLGLSLIAMIFMAGLLLMADSRLRD